MLDLAAVALALTRHGAVTATPERLEVVVPGLPAADGSTLALWRDGDWWCLRVVHSYGRASRLDAAVLAVAYQCRLRSARVLRPREATRWRALGAALEVVTESHDEATAAQCRVRGGAGGARE